MLGARCKSQPQQGFQLSWILMIRAAGSSARLLLISLQLLCVFLRNESYTNNILQNTTTTVLNNRHVTFNSNPNNAMNAPSMSTNHRHHHSPKEEQLGSKETSRIVCMHTIISPDTDSLSIYLCFVRKSKSIPWRLQETKQTH
jgi:hypothetical protein